MAQPIYVRGMSGLGDNLHQRALMRHWLDRGHEVWLETPWPAVYHDMPELRLRRRPEALRTQAKNSEREAARFVQVSPPLGIRQLQITYTPRMVHDCGGSVLAAMAQSVAVPADGLDFRFAPPVEWKAYAADLLRGYGHELGSKPILLYRPLVERREWAGCAARNPEADAYRDLFEAIRERFFVVSVADLVPGVEWTASHPAGADVELHAGELPFEALAGLMSLASLSFSSPGFAVILAQAVGTPAVCVFGGYETTSSFALGARLTPTLALGPHPGCGCFAHHHPCNKAFDVAAASAELERFIQCRSVPPLLSTASTSTGPDAPADS